MQEDLSLGVHRKISGGIVLRKPLNLGPIRAIFLRRHQVWHIINVINSCTAFLEARSSAVIACSSLFHDQAQDSFLVLKDLSLQVIFGLLSDQLLCRGGIDVDLISIYEVE